VDSEQILHLKLTLNMGKLLAKLEEML